jgi:hypothetical protein
MSRIRQHLTYANVMATIAVFIAVSGGTAVALNGTNTVFTDDIADDTRPASGGNPAGGLVAADLRPNSVGTSEVVNESLTGADIKNQSGVETCKTPTTKYGRVCAHSDGTERAWNDARTYCTGLGLRLPSNSEASSLALNYDVPGVGTGSPPIFFWTGDETYRDDAQGHIAAVYTEDGIRVFSYESTSRETVCVTDPSV